MPALLPPIASRCGTTNLRCQRRSRHGSGCSTASASCGTTTLEATRGASGHNTRIAPTAIAAPTNCNAMKPGTDDGAIPAHVSENIHANVTAGFAKLVDDVKN
jgi:hypothetical protein